MVKVIGWLGSPSISPLASSGPERGCTCLALAYSLLSPVPRSSVLPVPTEAAFTLLLYCELLQWEERPLREFLHYPSQTEWQRKEGLCRKVIHYFNKGKVGSLGKPPARLRLRRVASQRWRHGSSCGGRCVWW